MGQGRWSLFFNDTATTEIYTLSLHDALPILCGAPSAGGGEATVWAQDAEGLLAMQAEAEFGRSEEHTSELQSRQYLVCRLLLEKNIPRRLCLLSALSTPSSCFLRAVFTRRVR